MATNKINKSLQNALLDTMAQAAKERNKEMQAYVLINTSGATVRDTLERLQINPAVKSSSIVTGPYDIIALVEANDVDSIGMILTNEIQSLPGVTRTLTCIAVHV